MKFHVAALMMLLGAGAGPGEILDRVVAVINAGAARKVITLSDVKKEREIQKVIGRDLQNDKDVLEFLIERSLVEDQMQLSGVDVSDDEIAAKLKEIQDTRGIPRDDIRDAIRRELQAERYYDARFGQFIRPTDQELREYYENSFAPDARAQGRPLQSFEEIMQSAADATQLRTQVVLKKRDHEIETWLDSLKGRSDVEIFE